MKTALYDRQLALGAQFVSFAGWEMPVQYQSILVEHQTVRQRVGLFDVSHMGIIYIRGPDSGQLLDYLSTNWIKKKPINSATYTIWCHSDGGCVDDVIVYKICESEYFVVVNASNRNKDLAHLLAYASLTKANVEIQDAFSGTGILSLQGPSALPLLASLVPEVNSLKPMHFLILNDRERIVISRTGYTGAGGFELYGPEKKVIEWWDLLMEKGLSYGIHPIGLGARDTLRLEMGFALYGHELSDTIAPNETVSAWTVKWDKNDFVGKEALKKIKNQGTHRWAYGVRLLDRGIPRQGCQVLKNGEAIGEVTSGSFSPTIGKGIALILTSKHLQKGEMLGLQIRQTLCYAEVAELPFIRKIA